jgi:enamine deaminase RidA (YjgF/YER057c/UK114 family)
MKATLATLGLTMADIVKVNVFLVGVPENGGKMDAPGMNEVFKTFFGSADQPNRPARSTVQVAALGRPTTLVEIEAIAAKAP